MSPWHRRDLVFPFLPHTVYGIPRPSRSILGTVNCSEPKLIVGECTLSELTVNFCFLTNLSCSSTESELMPITRRFDPLNASFSVKSGGESPRSCKENGWSSTNECISELACFPGTSIRAWSVVGQQQEVKRPRKIPDFG